MNEMHSIAEKKGYDWFHIKRMLDLDLRIGSTHCAVPGPDGFYGFGGMCFPKDTSAILKYAEDIECKLNVLSSALKKNTALRLKNLNNSV